MATRASDVRGRDVVKAVFLDRDGVINQNRPDHVKHWSEFHFLPGALQAVARLSQAGVGVFIITNQAIINRGMASRETVDWINRRMVEEIERLGGRVEAVAYCPHRPDERCGCRKPQPGLLVDLARRFGLDLRETAVIGDALTDLEAGQAVGCEAVLVLTGRGAEQLLLAPAAGISGFRVAADLGAATTMLLEPRDGVPVASPQIPVLNGLYHKEYR
ncbi:MAG: D-glycero-alpha-D-manno-heptose-1,7-bisphosphate 7-phosphatase [Chloroflexota bacterium]